MVLGAADTVVNAAFVKVRDEATAAQFVTVPGVKRIFPAREMRMVLDRAILLHKAVDAWNQIGADRAGLGIKIAILDSGIDSNHPAFQDTSLTPPDTFPRANNPADLAYTNSKTIGTPPCRRPRPTCVQAEPHVNDPPAKG